MNRYRIALAQGEARYREMIAKDNEILAQFGMKLLSVSGGISLVPVVQSSGRVNPWDVMNVPNSVWEWINPLLEELGQCRKSA
jgi:hypothetical protein|tara:strand:+ start:222 stop:470 length:249 start_codon:yes stop_codon:yes gene_type:complete